MDLHYVPLEDREASLERVLDTDLVIGAAGVSSLERLYLGVPQLVFPISKNQLSNSESLSTWGINTSPTLLSETSDHELDALVQDAIDNFKRVVAAANNGFVLLDGYGCDRIANYLRGDSALEISYRDAEPTDVSTFFLWVNSQSVQTSAGRTRQINPEEHIQWFSEALQSVDTTVTVLLVNGVPTGQCRLQRIRGKGEVILDYSIDSMYRGRGLARTLIESSLQRHQGSVRGVRYIAEVRHGNLASQKVLTSAGFKLTKTDGELLRFERHNVGS
jgi:RimJ/RimL family protein N-acetyltransferase